MQYDIFVSFLITIFEVSFFLDVQRLKLWQILDSLRWCFLADIVENSVELGLKIESDGCSQSVLEVKLQSDAGKMFYR